MQSPDFAYKATKDGRVLIRWKGRQIVTLSGVEAARFVEQAAGQDDEGLQLLMARFTGNFKRGNEKSRGPRKH